MTSDTSATASTSQATASSSNTDSADTSVGDVSESSTSSVVVSTTVPQTTTTNSPAKSGSSSSSSSIVAVVSRPKLSVSQTTNLNPDGTSVTIRGSGYDIAKGVYVVVCTQAAPGPQATCVGGVNIDGSASSSVWISSNPPNYAVGLTTPFSPDGSFTVELVIVAKSGALDCTVVKCGVVTRSDHLRYSDRSQDVFVPITFKN